MLTPAIHPTSAFRIRTRSFLCVTDMSVDGSNSVDFNMAYSIHIRLVLELCEAPELLLRLLTFPYTIQSTLKVIFMRKLSFRFTEQPHIRNNLMKVHIWQLKNKQSGCSIRFFHSLHGYSRHEDCRVRKFE
nr:hypothetical transcript [Hymenolepis microstoma]